MSVRQLLGVWTVIVISYIAITSSVRSRNTKKFSSSKSLGSSDEATSALPENTLRLHVCIAGQYRNNNDWYSIRKNIVNVNPFVTISVVTWTDTPGFLPYVEKQTRHVFGTRRVFTVIGEDYKSFEQRRQAIPGCFGNVAAYTYLRSMCGTVGAFPKGSDVHIVMRPDLRLYDPIRVRWLKKDTVNRTFELDVGSNGKKPLTLWESIYSRRRKRIVQKYVVSNTIFLNNHTIAVGLFYSVPSISANDHIAIGTETTMVSYYRYHQYLDGLEMEVHTHPFCNPLTTERYYYRYITKRLRLVPRFIDIQYDIVRRCWQRDEYAEESRHMQGNIACSHVENITLLNQFSFGKTVAMMNTIVSNHSSLVPG
eukprot:PhF_6_TR22685/c0_g1_i3/m.32299